MCVLTGTGNFGRHYFTLPSLCIILRGSLDSKWGPAVIYSHPFKIGKCQLLLWDTQSLYNDRTKYSAMTANPTDISPVVDIICLLGWHRNTSKAYGVSLRSLNPMSLLTILSWPPYGAVFTGGMRNDLSVIPGFKWVPFSWSWYLFLSVNIDQSFWSVTMLKLVRQTWQPSLGLSHGIFIDWSWFGDWHLGTLHYLGVSLGQCASFRRICLAILKVF